MFPKRAFQKTSVVAFSFTLLVLHLSQTAISAAPVQPRLSLENLWTLRDLSKPHWSPDGRLIAFTLGEPELDSSIIMITDLEGNVRRLTDPKVSEGVEARRQFGFLAGLLPEPWTPDGRKLLYLSSGNIYAVEVESGKIEPVVQFGRTAKGYTPQVYFNGPDPVLSPDGTRLAYVRESELWVLDLKKGQLTQLTSSHREGWHNMQPRWSPDGTHILYTAQAVEEQRTFFFPDFSGTVIDMKTGLIGLGRVRVGVIPAEGGETTWLEPPEGTKYSLRGGSQAFWSPDGKRIAINRISLDHTRREIDIASPETGTAATIWKEEVEHWISPMAVWIRWSPDSSHLLFTSEQDGWNHLYVMPASGGKPKQLTNGSFTVTSRQVYDNYETTPDWSPDGTSIYFPSNEVGTAERHLYSVPVSGGAWQKITPLPGVNLSSTLSPDGAQIAYVHSDPSNLPEIYVQKGAGSPRKLTNLAVPESLQGYRWNEPEIVAYSNRTDGTKIHARLHVPLNLDRSRKHPAVVFVHGAGYAQSVFRGWVSPDRNSFNHFLTQEGYIVLDVDFRGSSGYGRKFRLDVFDRIGEVDLDDVLSGVDYLRNLGYVDPDRIGIWGHSYGGFMVASAMFRSPETFAAGVAGAPVTDWERFFFLAPGYNEEHLGFPSENPEGTRRASPLTYAENLKRPFLILSGVQDVMHLDSAALVNKLLEHRKSFEWFFYPNEPHGMRQPQAREDYYRRIFDFFERHLKQTAQATSEN
jgi:dipeptidyl aminopeptidase/acylaminoacyl peptidase